MKEYHSPVWKQLDGELDDGELDGDGEPVDGEEEVVDADGDGIPLGCVETARTKPFSCFFKSHWPAIKFLATIFIFIGGLLGTFASYSSLSGQF